MWRKGNPGRGDSLSKDKGSRKFSKWQGAGVGGKPGLFMGSPGSKRLRSRLGGPGTAVRSCGTSPGQWRTWEGFELHRDSHLREKWLCEAPGRPEAGGQEETDCWKGHQDVDRWAGL